MALVQASLKAQLVSLFSSMKNSEMNEVDYADQLATIITNYIKTAQVSPGIALTGAGASAAGPVTVTGATTGPGSLQ